MELNQYKQSKEEKSVKPDVIVNGLPMEKASKVQDNALKETERAMEASSEVSTPACLSEKYTFLRPIGHGSQGKVYEAVRKSDGRHVAIKQLLIHSVSSWKAYDLFQREIEILSKLDMPGVATFYEAVEAMDTANPSAYIVQEYLDGRSLEDMLRGGYRFTMEQIFQIGAKLIALLDRLHHHDPQVIHRDIKPSNIMLKHVGADDFEVYLIDFGAVANPQVQGGGSTVAGTYGYMPSEQLMGKPEPASDVYALAATLVRLLSGEEPDKMQVVDFRLMIEPHLPNVPRPAIHVLQRMLDPSPESRLCDEKVLEQVFLEFANGHYDISNKVEYVTVFESDVGKYQDVETWNEALRGVKKYVQPGNVDLWMRLPEETPRNELPACYRGYAHLTKKDLIKRIFSCFNPSTAGSIFNGVRFICIILAGVVSLVYLFGFLYGGAPDSFFTLMFMLITSFLILFIGWLLFSSFLTLIFGWEPLYVIRNRYKENATMKRLIREGKKCIATVVDASLVQPDILYNTQIAMFKIRYKFNVVIAGEQREIFHEVESNHDMTRVMKPGDAFPILYDVTQSERSRILKKVDVSSIPFPVPIKETRILNVCCQTQESAL